MPETALAEKDLLDAIEEELLKLPPEDTVEPSHINHFGPGVYIKEATFPAGHIVLGHEHLTSHLNVMLKGHVKVVADGRVMELKGPSIFTSHPGRKLAIVLEETTWLNIHGTDETDLEKLEKMFIKKSEAFKAKEGEKLKCLPPQS